MINTDGFSAMVTLLGGFGGSGGEGLLGFEIEGSLGLVEGEVGGGACLT
jgi:hypothetical protein